MIRCVGASTTGFSRPLPRFHRHQLQRCDVRIIGSGRYRVGPPDVTEAGEQTSRQALTPLLFSSEKLARRTEALEKPTISLCRNPIERIDHTDRNVSLGSTVLMRSSGRVSRAGRSGSGGAFLPRRGNIEQLRRAAGAVVTPDADSRAAMGTNQMGSGDPHPRGPCRFRPRQAGSDPRDF